MIQTFTDFATRQYGNSFTMACGIITATPVVETTSRVFYDLYMMWETVKESKNSGTLNDEKIALYSGYFTRDLGFSLFYGILASNVIPGSSVLGAGFFLGHSIWKYYGDYPECYLTSKVLIRTIEFVVRDVFYSIIKAIVQQIIWPATKVAWNMFIKPVCQNLIFPLFKKIYALTSRIFQHIGYFFAKIHLKSHPIWVGVIVLAGAATVYKLAIPLILTPIISM